MINKEQKPPSSSSSSQKPKNFQIPNLTPVLQCYDVPEPMILPPGSDPATFINPNPDKGCGFTPISTMNIDPCVAVATCYEIFSKTSDLTASEHAGVTLSEHTTMVSKATSNCFASLEVIDQYTVNDLDKFKSISPMDVDSHVVVDTVKVESSGESDVVVATNIESNVVVVVNKIENNGVAAKTESDVVVRKVENGAVATTNGTKSKNGCSFVCDVCNVTCNSEKILEIHKEGKAHMRKSKNLQVSLATKQEPPSPKANGILYHESEKRLQDLLATKPKPPSPDTNGNLAQEFEKRPQVSLATKQEPPSLDTNGFLELDQESEKRPQVSLATKQEPPSPYPNGILDQVTETQISAATKQEQPSADTNGISDQVSETKNQNLLQKEASLGSLFFCSIPDLDSVKQKIQSIATEEVTVPSCMDQFPNSTPLSTTLHQPSNGLAQNNNHELKIHQPVSCLASTVSRSGDKFLEEHNSGKEDLKNHEASEEMIKSPPLINSMQSTPIYKTLEDLKSTENKSTGDSAASKAQWCDVCKISCMGDDINNHLSGKNHLKNLRNSVLKPNSPSAVESLKLPDCEVVNPNEENPFRCEACQISCNSHEVLQSHLSGKKHKKKMVKPETARFGLSPPPSSSLATKPLHDPPSNNEESSKVVVLESGKRKVPIGSPENETKRQKKATNEEEGKLTCTACEVVCNSTRGFIDHLASEEHSARNRSTLSLMECDQH